MTSRFRRGSLLVLGMLASCTTPAQLAAIRDTALATATQVDGTPCRTQACLKAKQQCLSQLVSLQQQVLDCNKQIASPAELPLCKVSATMPEVCALVKDQP